MKLSTAFLLTSPQNLQISTKSFLLHSISKVHFEFLYEKACFLFASQLYFKGWRKTSQKPEICVLVSSSCFTGEQGLSPPGGGRLSFFRSIKHFRYPGYFFLKSMHLCTWDKNANWMSQTRSCYVSSSLAMWGQKIAFLKGSRMRREESTTCARGSWQLFPICTEYPSCLRQVRALPPFSQLPQIPCQDKVSSECCETQKSKEKWRTLNTSKLLSLLYC